MNMGKSVRIGLTLVLAAAAAQDVAAQNWPQWRGPQRNGHLPNVLPFETWPESLTEVWRVPVGEGYSSPVAENGKAWLLTRRGEDEVVRCFDLENGKTLWEQSYTAPFNTNQYATRFGKGPFSTPTLAEGKLYTLGVGGIVTCFDAATGDVLWRYQFTDGPPDSKTFFSGSSMSPLIDGERCIVHIGDDKYGALTAFHKDTGKEIWAWRGDNPGYASPIIVSLDGVRQVVTLTQHFVVGVAVDSGKLLWNIPFQSDWRENMPTPVVFDGMIIYSGVGRGVTAIAPQKSGEDWQVPQRWHNDEVSLYMNSPVLANGRFWGMSHRNKGQFFALDASTGTLIWHSEGRQGQNAAIVRSGDVLLILITGGELLVVDGTSEEYAETKRYKVASSATWAMPVIWGEHVLLKDADTLSMLRWVR